MPVVELVIGGRTFQLRADQYVLKIEQEGADPQCISGFMGFDVPAGPLWILGDIFLGAYHSERFSRGTENLSLALSCYLCCIHHI